MRLMVMLLGVALLTGACWAQDMAEIEGDHSVTTDFVTPHTAWAKPYALGQTRVLFFVNGRGTNPREVIELRQRFDFDAQMVFWARIIDTNRDQWHGAENGIRRMAKLLTEQWDAFVFIDVSPELMPIEQQYPMIKAITGGAGVVLLGTNDKRLLKAKNELKELPTVLQDVAGAKAFTVSQGRGLQLPARPSIPYGPGWEVAYDEWDMRLGKAILWAANKAPKLELKLTPKGQELARATLPAAGATLQWQGGSGTAEVTLRREDGVVVGLPAQALKAPQGSLDLSIPVARTGGYHLDVIARTGKAVAGFASIPLKIVDELAVSELKLDRDWTEIGETLSGSITLSRPAAAGTQRVVLRVLDRRGREIARAAEFGATGGPFKVRVQPWWPMLVRLEATVLEGDREAASAWQFARIVKRHQGQFNFVMWDVPSGNLAPYGEETLARNGVTIQLGSAPLPPPQMAAHEIAWIPYTTHIYAKSDEQGVMKPACWNDEAGVQAYVDEVVAKYAPARQHGVFVYSLGDEIAVRGSCLSPHCLAAYRRYLKDQYQTLAALNASWGSNYASFEEVQLSKPDDNNEATALQAGNFPRWYDRQAFQSHNFCQLCERFGKAFRKIDPQSRCGFEGAGTFKDGDDLDGFVRSNEFWSPYPGTADEVLRSIAPRDFPRANWMGYTKDAETLLQKYWRMVTRGCDSVWWWRWEALGRFHGWIAPSLDPYPAVKEILKDTQIVRDGLGDLLLTSEMQTDGIGILYSQPSAYAAKVQTAPSYGSFENSHSAFHTALRELGCNFSYFTDRQMRLGEVDLQQFKLVILPLTQAMGPQEAAMLREYVQQGGVLMADVRPALYDGHVKPLTTGALDEVFGVKRAAAVEGQPLDVQSGDLTLPKLRVDTSVVAAGAQAAGAAGQTPVLLTNSFGKGKAMLLNLSMSSYPTLASETTPAAAATLLQSLLTTAAIKPALPLLDASGQRVRNVEITRWMNGPVQIVSILRHQGTPEAAVLKLPQALYAYDLKAAKDLGKQQNLSLTITPYRAQFYALSPQPLKPLQMRTAATASRGSVQRLALSTTLPQGRQAARVQVTLPGGAPADWVDTTVVTDRRGCSVEVPVALNDPQGTWTVNVTELYTGKTTTAQFAVR